MNIQGPSKSVLHNFTLEKQLSVNLPGTGNPGSIPIASSVIFSTSVKTITIIDSLVLPGIGYDRRQACSQTETEELTSEYGGVDSYLDFYLYISFLEVSTPHRVGENEGRLFDLTNSITEMEMCT
jgi:hypothetical protein